MRPDAIFFLTDVDNPMTGDEVEGVRRRNRGNTAIYTIEFGYGPATSDDNFLVRLAQQNGGTYTYVDTSKLGK
jgi:Ca-activated chloride channel family protein